MQPVVFWQPVTMPPLPVSPSAPETLGQDTVVLTLEELQSPGSWALRYEVNRKVLPELSARCSGTIAVAGSDTPGLSAVIAESCHFVILPEEICASTLPLSLRCADALTPGML